eukprot:gene17418-20783_t
MKEVDFFNNFPSLPASFASPRLFGANKTKKAMTEFVHLMGIHLANGARLVKANATPSTNGGLNSIMVGNNKWTALFYQRLALSEELISQDLLNHITSCLRTYLAEQAHRKKRISTKSPESTSMVGASPSETAANTDAHYISVAEGMLEYITRRVHDVDNSLIGFTVASNVVSQLTYRRFESTNHFIREMSPLTNLAGSLTFSTKSLSSSCDSTALSSSGKKKLMSSNKHASTAVTLPPPAKEEDPAQLIQLMNKWSKMTDKRLSNELREFVAMKREEDTATLADALVKGDLVIFRYPNTKESAIAPKYMFGRFTGQICDSPNSPFKEMASTIEYLSVYTNPTETEWIWIKRDDIFKISNQPGLQECMTSAKKMASLIECPSVNLHKIIETKEDEILRGYLESRGLSSSLVDRLEHHTVSLRDLKELRTLCGILSQLSANLPQELVLASNKMVAAEVGRFLSNVCLSTLYIPTRRALLLALERAPEARSGTLKLRASVLRGLCDVAVSKLISQKLEILDGQRKLRVVNWWLSMIKDQVELYLVGKGFDCDAVPADYTVTPPANLQKVASNLVVLHNCLPSAGSADPELTHLVKRLKNAIYPVIEDFNLSIKSILAEWLDMEVGNSSTALDLLDGRAFLGALERNSSTLSMDNISKIKRMLKDSDYLTEMVKLENSISDSFDDSRRFETEIIPISGLIFGRLFRIENELRTVIECWKDIDQTNHIASPMNGVVNDKQLQIFRQEDFRLPFTVEALVAGSAAIFFRPIHFFNIASF